MRRHACSHEVRAVIPVPRSLQEILNHASELADRAESCEPRAEDEIDRKIYVALRDATTARANAEHAVAVAVNAARARGVSWSKIGAVLGTSGEAVRQRYGRRLTGTSASSRSATI